MARTLGRLKSGASHNFVPLKRAQWQENRRLSRHNETHPSGRLGGLTVRV